VQDLSLGLAELYEVLMGSLLKPVKVPLVASLPSSLSTALLSLMSSTNVLKIHSIPLSMPLIH